MSEQTSKRVDFIVKVVYWAVLLVLGYYALMALGLVMPFIMALILVASFQPLVRFLHRKFKIYQKFTSIIMMLILYTAIGIVIYWITLRLVYFLRDFFVGFPDYYTNNIAPTITNFGIWSEGFLGDVPDEIQAGITNSIWNFVESISNWGIGFATGFINSIPSFLLSLVFMVLLSFFLCFDYNKVIEFLKAQLPPKGAEFIARLKKLSINSFGRYVRAYAIIMGITFVILSIAFLIIGTPNPIGIAAAIAVFDFLPVLGAGSVLAVWAVIELILGNMTYAIGLGVIWAIIMVVRNIIEPKIVGDSLGINPIIAIIAVYAGYRLLGVMGMVLFPILAQILIVLHQSGTIKLYKENSKNS
ncbi:MAG: sporulation integral membrane protein YtvI [Oscillospiraceae bacterium]|nr:sporulation integral membrane protein YtvI [Oscillospiraceae bacterium]